MSLAGHTAKQIKTSPTILVVEDELSVATSLTEALEDRGYQVVNAKDGISAVTTARQVKPAAVILDLGLPKQNGLDVLDRFRNDKALFALPVIVLTEVESSVILQRCTELGMSCYLAKSHSSLPKVLEQLAKIVAPPK